MLNIFPPNVNLLQICKYTHKIATNWNENLTKRRWFIRSWNRKTFSVLKKVYLIYTNMACFLKTLDFIYSLYSNKAKKIPIRFHERMLRYLFMRRHTWNCSTRQSTQDGIWHILLFFLVYDKYKEIKMYLVVQVILHVHTCTWFPTTKINHKKVDVILKSALGMKCSEKNITIQ